MTSETHLAQATHGCSLQALRYKQQPNRICVRPPTDVPCTRSDTNSNRTASVSGHPRIFRARAPIQTAAEPHLCQATHGRSVHALRYKQQPNRMSADDDPLAKLPGVDHLRQARALDLPARGLRDRRRLHEQHARGAMALLAMHALHDLAHEALAGAGVRRDVTHLGHDVEPLRTRSLAVDADGRGVANARHVVDDLLDVGRHDVLAADDDDVLETPRDIEIALGVDESKIAGAQPAVGGQHLRGRLGVVVVALHHPRALHADLALDIRRKVDEIDGVALAHRLGDAQLDAATWLAHRQAASRRVVAQRDAAWPDGNGQRRLGQAIAGNDHVLDPEV